MQREELRSKRKENRKFVGEGGVAALYWQRGGRMGQTEQWRYTMKKKFQCWKVGDPREAEAEQRRQL